VRRRIILAAIVAIVVALGGVASVTVVAQSRDRAARQLEVQRLAAEDWLAIRAASRAGLTSAELAPSRHKLRRLSGALHASSPWLLGGPSISQLNAESRSLHSLRLEVHRTLDSVRQLRKREADSALSALRSTIAQAQGLLVDVGQANVSLHRDDVVRAAAKTPRDYRTVTVEGRTANASLALAVQKRSAAVQSLLNSWQGNSVAGVQEATVAVQTMQPELDLLAAIKPKTRLYQTRLRSLLDDARRSSDSTRTAATVLVVQETVAAVNRDFTAAMPVKAVVVYTGSQSLALYDHDHVILTSDVTTGGPGLETSPGVYHIYFKASPFTFHSPWPPSSPYYYLPTDVQYWMPFDGGQGLHDASWRSNFGPGSNFAPTDLGTGNYVQGTHGCVNLPLATAQFIWDWAPIGTAVVVM